MNGEKRQFNRRITIDSEVMVGKPVVAGTRIPVELVLKRLANNPDLEELFADYPRLTCEDVQACLEYARRMVQRTPRRVADRELVAPQRGL